jgi:hypothetical protein
VKATIRHYFDFSDISKTVDGHLDTAQAWDALRLESAASNMFAIPSQRQPWLKRCEQEPFVKEQAAQIASTAGPRFKRINSYGVGPGFLEFFIKQACPEIFLHCSDYTVQSIQRLRDVFTEADQIDTFDMLSGQWPNGDPSTLHLLYRVDTVFDNSQWQSVFERMASYGVRHVLFIPCEFLTLRRWAAQQVKFYIWPLLGRKIASAGYLRTKDQFLDLFSGFYRIEQELDFPPQLRGFLLTLKDQSA